MTIQNWTLDARTQTTRVKVREAAARFLFQLLWEVGVGTADHTIADPSYSW